MYVNQDIIFKEIIQDPQMNSHTIMDVIVQEHEKQLIIEHVRPSENNVGKQTILKEFVVPEEDIINEDMIQARKYFNSQLQLCANLS